MKTVAALRKARANLKYPKTLHLPGDDWLPDDSYCLTKEGSLYSVFYSERGKRSVEQHFGSEEYAVSYLLDMLRKNSWAKSFGVDESET